MEFAPIDIVIFVVFVIAVVSIGLIMSRGEKDTGEDYFLAGRGLSWWLIGFSLIAANISAEQFVGMSGQAAKDSIGLAVASYEWVAAITLVVVAFFFLPKFLQSGIFTIPEFLEYRFDHIARTVMSFLMVIIYVFVTITTVIYLGAKALDPLFSGEVFGIAINIKSLSWVVGIVAAIYVAVGGLKACAWADLIQGSALIVGGAVIMVLAFMALDKPENFEGINVQAVQQSLDVGDDAALGEKFGKLKEEKMHMVLPRSSDFLPWTALLIGIWIPNFYYWGLNQFIMQRTLGSKSLAHGQDGIVFAAALKLIIPFIVCIPGILAFTLYGEKMKENAMTSETLNSPILEKYEAAKTNPDAANMVFRFDDDFASLYPEMAGNMLAMNAKVAGEAVPSDMSEEGKNLSFVERNSILLKTIPKESEIEKSQILVGYDYDGAFPLLIRYLTPPGLRGFVVAALMGAVISSLASMLNAASTIFTMDVYREYIHKKASQHNLVWVGRVCIPIFVVVGCFLAPKLADPKFSGAFAYIQEFQGFISPGILTIFLYGLFIPWTPRICGTIGLVLSPVVYGFLYFVYGDMAFLNRMAITVGVLAAVLLLITVMAPLKEPVTLPSRTTIEMKASSRAHIFGWMIIAATIALYIIFR